MTDVDDAAAFDAALFAEIASLLPQADVVHLVEYPHAVGHVPLATARRRVEDASRDATAHVVAAWAAAYPDVAPPPGVAVELDLVGRGRVRVTAIAVRRDSSAPVRLDAQALAASLRAVGWVAEPREVAVGVVSVLGHREALRLDATARPPALFGLRVTSAPVAVGAIAAAIAEQPRQRVPWTACR